MHCVLGQAQTRASGGKLRTGYHLAGMAIRLAAIVLGTQEWVVFSRLAQVEFVSGLEAG